MQSPTLSDLSCGPSHPFVLWSLASNQRQVGLEAGASLGFGAALGQHRYLGAVSVAAQGRVVILHVGAQEPLHVPPAPLALQFSLNLRAPPKRRVSFNFSRKRRICPDSPPPHGIQNLGFLVVSHTVQIQIWRGSENGRSQDISGLPLTTHGPTF